MARVLIVREEVSARQTARRLAALGHETVVFPLEQVVRLEPDPPQEPFDGFVVTSAQAVPALAALFPNDQRPCFAVGETTGAALESAGFTKVLSAEGDARSLAALIERSSENVPRDAKLLYAAGRNRSGSLEAALDGTPVALLITEVYDVVRTAPREAEIRACLEGAGPNAVLLLSQAQAAAFADLVLPQLKSPGSIPRLLCLSERIADALPSAIRRKAEISAHPKLDLLFERL